MPAKTTYTRAEMFKIVGIVLGTTITTIGGGGYLLKAPVEQTDQTPGPKKKIAESDLQDIKSSIEKTTEVVSVIRDSVLMQGREQQHMKESLQRLEDANKATAQQVARLRRSAKPLYSCEELFTTNLASLSDGNQ